MTSAPILVELPYRIDFKFYLNSDFVFEYWMANEDGTPITNTGYRIDMEVRRVPGATLLGAYTTVNGRVTLGGADGKVTVRVPYSVIVADYIEGRYRYDILETDTAGHRQALYYGDVDAIAMITAGA